MNLDRSQHDYKIKFAVCFVVLMTMLISLRWHFDAALAHRQPMVRCQRFIADQAAVATRTTGPSPLRQGSPNERERCSERRLGAWQSGSISRLSTEGISCIAGERTPTVTVVFDKSGEVAACVADVALVESALSPCWINAHAPALAAARVLLLDGNLAPGAIEAACTAAAESGVPVWFEPVSAAKSVRAVNVLRLLRYISPNEAELAAMADAVRQSTHSRQSTQAAASTGCPSGDVHRGASSCGSSNPSDTDNSVSPCGAESQGSGSSCPRCIATLQGRHHASCPRSTTAHEGQHQRGCGCCSPGPVLGGKSIAGDGSLGRLPSDVSAALRPLLCHIAVLLQAGVGSIVLTMGPLGAALCTPGDSSGSVLLHHFPALPAEVVNCSGAGDCLVAGCLWGLIQGLPDAEWMACGVAASCCAVQSQYNVPPLLSPEVVGQHASAVAKNATHIELRLV